MKYFDQYTSNTTASSQNQYIFESDGTPVTGRVYYKISAGGKFGYSLLFSNIVDSTFRDGSVSHANMVCRPWHIHSARLGRCMGGIDHDAVEFTKLAFDGNSEKDVAPGEFFASDPVMMEFRSGDFLCLEMTFSGTLMPYHEESIIPIFRKAGDGWVPNKQMPLPGMVGCDRAVKERIAYLGDSITQGIGTEYNSYTHWNAVLAGLIGDGYSHWNGGIGCARAADSAADGAWMYKLKHSDITVVCVGANDVLINLPAEAVRAHIARTVDLLTRDGRTVVLQTIPPFEYAERQIPVWKSANKMIKEELASKVAMVFDVAAAIGDPVSPNLPLYGGHPDAKGCKIWGEKLYSAMKENGIV